MTPSPSQVVSDLIDATCHEILLIGGSESESIAPFASYAKVAQRLDYYMELLDRDQDDAEVEEDDDDDEFSFSDDKENDKEDQPVLIKDMGVRLRFLMASLTMGVCARLAYPEVFVDTSQPQQPGSNLPPLIYLSASQWNKLRKELGKLQGKFQRGDGKINPLFVSVICQMKAMEALAKLRNHLLVVVAEINQENDGTRSASHFSYVRVHLEEYEMSSHVIDGKLQNNPFATHEDLFVPQHMLSLKRCSTIKRMKDSVISLIEGIDGMVTKKVFPLHKIQVQFSELLKDWEKSYLSPPALFKAGYFHSGEPSSSSPIAAGASTPVSPTTPVGSPRGRRKVAKMPHDKDESDSGDESDSDDDELPMVAKSQNKAKARRSSPARARGRKRGTVSSPTSSSGGTPPPRKKVQKRKPKRYDSDSDSSMSNAPAMRMPKKKTRKRIPFTEEEDRAILEGVVRFGSGKWREILTHYDEVFEVNSRTNVNVKDRYRSLMKVK
eukprot:CAMPEP_0201891570 /NCGR_PEP_ID=MMETSP0902-20130614/34715_1 /ASSEMBLY_ACC=CAM_ASM_000551 /TAXON_ID=420261 /ORGANISM="Thalassiosira antarctica, Strain CCMP982" /LENGTH=494 /DNA_ID=CAMNT_0048422817 /DNA_START=251 /DNA_END=1735 /DNA_ORIENTATION=-